MTIDEIQERLCKIRTMKDDEEAAHGCEDDLYLDVLTAIANGADNPRELAALAIVSKKIDFARWYA